MRFILIGAPGAGKGTIASFLKDEYDLIHISTGDIFRAQIKAGTPLGIKAHEYIENGQLVPDEITIDMVKDRLCRPDCKTGFMLDGFPRTIPQAQALDAILDKNNLPIEAVLNLIVPDKTIVKRISDRRICRSCGEGFSISFNPTQIEGVCDACGGEVVQREDDRPETVLERLKTYKNKTKPLLDYYATRGIIIDVDNSSDPEFAIRDIRAGLKKMNLS